MAGETKSGMSSLVFAVIFILAMGVGGYFTGQYFDTKENDRLISEVNQEKLDRVEENISYTITYSNEEFGIALAYPLDWDFGEENNDYTISKEEYEYLEEDVFVVRRQLVFTSPSGSFFVYLLDDELSNEYVICGSGSDDNGDVLYNDTCVSQDDFDRFEFEVSNEDHISGWRVAENHEDLDGDELAYKKYDGFYYQVAVEEDLELLDQIMSSVARL